ncbi:MAG: aconitate hydratase [Acidobacteriota bacterium]|nr:aconitate hydratase [Acidobacteriota bacterium]
MAQNSFGSKGTLDVGDRSFQIFRLAALQSRFDVARLPFCLKVLLENLLRHEGSGAVTARDVEALASWKPDATPAAEIAFSPARVLMQDFTGVPAIVDLAAMRDAMAQMGGDEARINPLVPVELVIDHSVQVDAFGTHEAFRVNAERELERNRERYSFLRWAQSAFQNLAVVPPDTGICHQVNIEYLARVVFGERDGDLAYPDTLVGTDSHTTMVNGLGVLGWGVGGIEAEAAMLGQPMSMLIPQVLGIRLHGALREGATATDLVLTVTELLRERGVVGKFVELFGAGLKGLPIADRATIGNMSPEFGSTCAISPIDSETLRYLELTGRPREQIDLVEAYCREQGLWHDEDSVEPAYSDLLELDLRSVEPSLAGPRRPQDRIALSGARDAFRGSLPEFTSGAVHELHNHDEALAESYPASDPPANGIPGHEPVNGQGRPAPPGRASAGAPVPGPGGEPAGAATTAASAERQAGSVTVALGGESFELAHGAVVIAAITSCTNTSNPSVMVGAGLLARNALARGLARKPWVKTSLAPGSRVVTEYLDRAGLTEPLEALGFNLVGYGCTTCIGNSGPLPPEISEAVGEHDLAVVSVLSGNRNFEGRINQDVKMNYLASPPLCVAYAIAGTMDIDITSEPLGIGSDGGEVFLRDVWPSEREIAETIGRAVFKDMFRTSYASIFDGDEHWRELAGGQPDDGPGADGGSGSAARFAWGERSTYVRRPPFFEDLPRVPAAVGDIEGARVLALLGDSVTTDHISPAGAIKRDGPAGLYLQEQGVTARDFNSYGSRRGNHEVMMRGTFANIRLHNLIGGGQPLPEGGYTRHFSADSAEQTTIYDAAMRYLAEGVPLVVLAGREYGSGSSRDWAAKGTSLLGVRAVIAESFERIHRSNLVGMGVLPLQLPDGQSVGSLGLSGEETISVTGISAALEPGGTARTVRVRAERPGAEPVELQARVRIDTPREIHYFEHGGILNYVLRGLLGANA